MSKQSTESLFPILSKPPREVLEWNMATLELDIMNAIVEGEPKNSPHMLMLENHLNMHYRALRQHYPETKN